MSDSASIKAESAKEALLLFLKEKDIYCEVEVTEFDSADARVVIKNGNEDTFFRIIEKESISIIRPTAIEQKDIIDARRLLEQKVITIYHGTKDPNLKVDYNYNNKNNDYGKGFYTTSYADLGREWAYASYTRGDKGYLYEYSLDLSDLEVLNLTEKDSVHWVAELITNRTLNTENKEALRDTIELFKKKYKLDTSHTDVIIGYRADDSYFTYAEDFINGAIYKDTLEAALRNGNLGIQVFIKSEKAFKALKQVGTPVEVPSKYKEYYEKRDKGARNKYREDKINQVSRTKIRVFDLL